MSWIQKLHHSIYSKCRPLSISHRWADFHRFSKAHQHVSWSDSEDQRQTTHSLSCISCQDIEYIYIYMYYICITYVLHMYYICIHMIHGIKLNKDIQGWTNMYYDMFMVQGVKDSESFDNCSAMLAISRQIGAHGSSSKLSSIKNNASFAWAWSDQSWHMLAPTPWPSLWILGREELGVGVVLPLARHQQSLQEGASTSQVLKGSNGLCGYGSKMGSSWKRTFLRFLWFSAIMLYHVHNFIIIWPSKFWVNDFWSDPMYQNYIYNWLRHSS